MNEIKLSLSIELQGGTMLSKEECLKTTHKVIKKETKAGKIDQTKAQEWYEKASCQGYEPAIGKLETKE